MNVPGLCQKEFLRHSINVAVPTVSIIICLLGLSGLSARMGKAELGDLSLSLESVDFLLDLDLVLTSRRSRCRPSPFPPRHPVAQVLARLLYPGPPSQSRRQFSPQSLVSELAHPRLSIHRHLKFFVYYTTNRASK